MNNELVDLIVTLDSREKEQKRLNSMRSFFEERGAVVDVGAITIKDGGQITSVDYSIEGSYKGKPVNLGISAKSLVDFSGTIGNISNELARGYLRFDDVGFVLITGCYQTTLSSDGLHAVVRNPAVQDGTADILNTTSMFNALSSWERSGIHCRQILYEEQFPQAVISILNFITKDHHEGVCFCTKEVSNPSEKAKMDFTNAHTHLGIPGFGVKTALKLWDYLIEWNYPPNLHFAASLSEDDLKDAIGVKTGKALYEAYRNRAGWLDVCLESRNYPNKINSLPSEYIKNSKENVDLNTTVNKPGVKSLKSPLNQSDSKIITDSNKSSQLSQVSKGKADELSTIVPLKPNNIERCVLDSVAGEGTESEREPIDKPHCSRSADLDNNLQSSSADEITFSDAGNAKHFPQSGTPDTLQSPEVHHIPLTSVDTAEDSFFHSIDTPTSSAGSSYKQDVVNSLEDAIVDRVYDKPEIDTVIIREFMGRGFQMPEIHKTIKESKKLHKYKHGGDVMIAYKGVKADKEMDVGV